MNVYQFGERMSVLGISFTRNDFHNLAATAINGNLASFPIHRHLGQGNALVEHRRTGNYKSHRRQLGIFGRQSAKNPLHVLPESLREVDRLRDIGRTALPMLQANCSAGEAAHAVTFSDIRILHADRVRQCTYRNTRAPSLRWSQDALGSQFHHNGHRERGYIHARRRLNTH